MRRGSSPTQKANRQRRVAMAMTWTLPGQREGFIRFAHKAAWCIRFFEPLDGPALESWKPDGIVCQLHPANAALVQAVRLCAVPTVELFAFIHSLPCVRVRCDHTALGRIAAEHLIERGFRRLVHIGRRAHPPENNYLTGFNAAARATGTEVDEIMIEDPALVRKYGAWDGKFGLATDRYPQFLADMAKRIARRGAPPTGVFMQSSLLAKDIARSVLNLGVQVPEQVAILALRELPYADDYEDIRLSYVREDYETQGYRAAETLDRLMRGETVPPLQWIRPLPVVTLASTDTLAMTHQPTAAAMKYFREHAFERSFALKQAAQSLGVGIRTMERWFRQHAGMSPADYLETRRTDRAAELLATSTMSLTQVAHASGFSDRRHLKRALLRRKQCIPQAIREETLKRRPPPRAPRPGSRPVPLTPSPHRPQAQARPIAGRCAGPHQAPVR